MRTRTTSSSCRRSAASAGSCTRRPAKDRGHPSTSRSRPATRSTCRPARRMPRAPRTSSRAISRSASTWLDGATCSRASSPTKAEALDAPVPAGWLDDPDGFARELQERLAALAGALGRGRRRNGGRRAPRAVPLHARAAGARHDRRASRRRSRWTTPRSSPAGRAPSASCPPTPERSRGPPRRSAPRDAGVAGAGDAADRPARATTVRSPCATSRSISPTPRAAPCWSGD